jgi:biopolymer transport protein ExbD
MNVGEQEEGGLMSEINTTPLVDVMLVLLIIFLITVPVVIQTVPVELPKVVNIPTTTKPENVPLSVDANCEIYWGLTKMESTDQLREKGATYLLAEVERMKAAGAKIELPEVHIRGDSQSEYRCIGGAIFAMQRAGYQKIGFISEPPAGTIVKR